MFSPDLYYETLLNWIKWLTQFGFAHVLITLAIAWIVLLAAPDSVASGKLFEQKNAWIAVMILAIFCFIFLVIPIISWQLFVGILISAALFGLTIILKGKKVQP